MKLKIIYIQQNNTDKKTFRAVLHGTNITGFAKTEINALKNLVEKLEKNDSKHILSNIK